MVKDTLMPKKVVRNKKGEIMPQKKKRLFIDKIEKVMFLHKQGNMMETQTTRHCFCLFLSPKENTFRIFTLYAIVCFTLLISSKTLFFNSKSRYVEVQSLLTSSVSIPNVNQM